MDSKIGVLCVLFKKKGGAGKERRAIVRRYVFLLALMLVFWCGKGFSFEHGDWQLWVTETVSGDLNDNWGVSLLEEERYGDDMSYFYQHHTDLGLTYKLDKVNKISLHMKYISLKKKGEWTDEYRPYINFVHKFTLFELKWSNKTQLEFRHQEHNKFYRFREKLTLKLPKLWNKKLSPFVSNEIFMDTETEKINRNRFSVGVKFKLIKDFSGTIYYLWQTDRKVDWKNTNVLGIKLGYKF